jgi:hypothetical protein
MGVKIFQNSWNRHIAENRMSIFLKVCKKPVVLIVIISFIYYYFTTLKAPFFTDHHFLFPHPHSSSSR